MQKKNTTDIYITDNPYGYRLRINHPDVLEWYKQYKNQHGIPIWCPLSDLERFEFERDLIASGKLNK